MVLVISTTKIPREFRHGRAGILHCIRTRVKNICTVLYYIVMTWNFSFFFFCQRISNVFWPETFSSQPHCVSFHATETAVLIIVVHRLRRGILSESRVLGKHTDLCSRPLLCVLVSRRSRNSWRAFYPLAPESL